MPVDNLGFSDILDLMVRLDQEPLRNEGQDTANSDDSPEPTSPLGFEKGRPTVLRRDGILVPSYEDRDGIADALEDAKSDPSVDPARRRDIQSLIDTLRPGSNQGSFNAKLRVPQESSPSVQQATWHDVLAFLQVWR